MINHWLTPLKDSTNKKVYFFTKCKLTVLKSCTIGEKGSNASGHRLAVFYTPVSDLLLQILWNACEIPQHLIKATSFVKTLFFVLAFTDLKMKTSEIVGISNLLSLKELLETENLLTVSIKKY